ncbi:MAG: Hsp20/alpha crystallin family protein [Planctomycetota bacterium]|jgi:HSP20 family protein|nr:Hsp20/alpha crystallin family protein [Planctomycetota bacterium]
MAVFGNFFFVGVNGEALTTSSFSTAVNSKDVWQPPVDIFEIDGGVLVQMDLPGIDPASLEVTLEGRFLIVRGVRRAARVSHPKRYIQMEISRGIFGKIIPLPAPVAEVNSTASLRNGVLEVFLPFGKNNSYAPTAIAIVAE